MKLQVIVNYFGTQAPTESEPRLGNRVFKNIKNFRRKVEMMPHIENMRNIYNLFNQEKQEKIRELLEEFCKDVNEKNKGVKDFKELKPEPGMSVPQEKMPELNKWFTDRMKVDIDVKPFKFKAEEIEATDKDGHGPIDPEELLNFKDFYDMKELQKYIKQASK